MSLLNLEIFVRQGAVSRSLKTVQLWKYKKSHKLKIYVRKNNSVPWLNRNNVNDNNDRNSDDAEFGADINEYIHNYYVIYYECCRFMSFSKYNIPREYLLNKTGDVTEDGRYETPYKV